MTRILLASLGLALTSALHVETPAFAGDDKFLGENSPVAPQQAYSNFGDSTCQFIYDYSWYNYVVAAEPTAYTATSAQNADTAYFTYCQYLSNTPETTCTGSYFASVEVGKVCTLNSNSVMMGAATPGNLQGATVAIVYSNNDNSTNGGTSQLTVNQVCNSASSSTGPLTDNGDGTFTTYQESSQACPIWTMNAFFQLMDKYKWIFGGVFLGIGVFLTFLGKKLFTGAIFVVSAVVVSFFIMLIFYTTFLTDNTASWIFWVTLSFSVVLGLVGGYFAGKMEKLGGMLLCAWGGYVSGVLLNETVLYLAGSTWLFWVVCIGLAVVAAIMGYVIFEPAVIAGTSFVGSYLCMRAFGIWFGGFPNEYVLQQQIKSGGIDNIDPVFYAYLAGVAVLTVVGCVVQFGQWKKQKEEEAHPYNKYN